MSPRERAKVIKNIEKTPVHIDAHYIAEVPVSKDKFAKLYFTQGIVDEIGISEKEVLQLFSKSYSELIEVAKKHEIAFDFRHIIYTTSKKLDKCFRGSGIVPLPEEDHIPKYAINDNDPYRLETVFLSSQGLANEISASYVILHETAHVCLPLANLPSDKKGYLTSGEADPEGTLNVDLNADYVAIYILKKKFPLHKRAFREALKYTYLVRKGKEHLGEGFNWREEVENIETLLPSLIEHQKGNTVYGEYIRTGKWTEPKRHWWKF